jgi:hypothetical protein
MAVAAAKATAVAATAATAATATGAVRRDTADHTAGHTTDHKYMVLREEVVQGDKMDGGFGCVCI